jgi:pSer/pThr/pTyr-binding forkhead associated (FHA) protein
MSLLRRIEKSLDQRLRSIFSGGDSGEDAPGAREAIELYHDALDQIAKRAAAGKRGDRIFPFNLITIELAAENAERKVVLETLFDAGQLGDDIRATLKEERVTLGGELTVLVKYPDDALVEMRVICERGEPPQKAAADMIVRPTLVRLVSARLVTVTGVSSAAEFILDRPRINLGREAEITDSLGRAIRRNELFFPESAHEANPSVSRAHAHIRFEPSSGEWRIFDDGSSIGTTLFRDGRRIDVPAHAGRGVALRAGDEIYLGQVRLQFELGSGA